MTLSHLYNRWRAPDEARGFSLLELLVVIGIIALLTGILLPVVTSVTARARQTKCKSNLRQFAVAINVYRADHRGRNPDWLSTLYPEYIDTKEIYICPADGSRGADGGKPNPLDRYWQETRDGNPYSETYDIPSNPHRTTDTAIEKCSYFYEFNAATCSWGDGTNTWNQEKMIELRTGNEGGPYSESRMPIIRCYHHWDEGHVEARDIDTGNRHRDNITINVGYAGNIFVAPLDWRERVDVTD